MAMEAIAMSTSHSTADAQDASPRPRIARDWQTERPPPLTTASWTPNLARRTTNISALNEAIWNSPANEDDSSSCFSSDSEDSRPIEGKKTNGRPKSQRVSTAARRGSYSGFNVKNDEFKTKGKVSKRDGRLNISLNETKNRGYIAKALGASFLKHLSPQGEILHEVESRKHRKKPSRESSEATLVERDIPLPKLNIVVMVIGSRGDIQPFLKLGKILKEYGHRVRIATHPAFKDFVENDSGLEFFSVGGDPAELMAFMVKNPGMIPTLDTLKKGEVGRRRSQMAEMFEGFWRASINASDGETDETNKKMIKENHPFVADAIIANPPSFAHIHCAERLGVPLHLMFTFPYTPTQAFPHPLANIKKTNVDPGYANFISYPLVEMMTWQGLGDLINNFRVKTLGLEPVSTLWAPGQLYRMKVPYTYLWSPGLIPKPSDWGPEIDIAGFVFLDLASSFKPPEDLVKFLDEGEPPIYIGFGSIVVDDPDKFTEMIFEAVKKAGVRALVSKGWGGLGNDSTPEGIFMLDNTPHDWLFPKVKAVVHHGGAGTTAIGLKCGKPTMIVPFFGDQQFWGSMISKAGAGAEPVPYKSLTADKLAEGIKQCLSDKAREEAEKLAKNIADEGDGAKNAVTSFHRSLVLRGHNSMRCAILEDRVATWTLKNTQLRLSALAAELLVKKKKLHWKQLRLIRHNEWNDFEGPGEPITGAVTAVTRNLAGAAGGVGKVPFKIARAGQKRTRHEEKKKRKSEDAQRRSTEVQEERPEPTNDLKALYNAKKDSQLESTSLTQHNQTGPGASMELSQDPSAKEAEQEEVANPPDATAPARGEDHNTDLGKKTPQGEPVGQKEQANKEHDKQHFPATNDMDSDSELSEDPEDNIAEEVAQNVGSGLGETAEHLARMPMDLSLAIAQGFHNAPRLYGDDTVRRPTRITGYKSGLKAAGQEFVFGIYDGVTGLVVQPYTGARAHGLLGFTKGIGMGLTGFVLKDLAAVFGPFGYTLKGVHKELLKHKQPTRFIRQARILQGQREAGELSEKDREKVMQTVCHGWSVVLQVWDIMEQKRSQGLKGRVQLLKERKSWRANGAFENVEMAEKALEARKKGESLDEVFAAQREELKLAQKPRKNVVSDLKKSARPGMDKA